MIRYADAIPELATALKEAFDKWIEDIKTSIGIPETAEPVPIPIYTRR